MDYRIMKKEAFRVVGKALRVSVVNGQNLTNIPDFWTQCNQDGTGELLGKLSDDSTMLGICANFSAEMNEFDYLVAVPNKSGVVPAGCIEMAIPVQTWAVFDAVGRLPQSIQSVTSKIFSEWFPASSFEHAEGPEMEVYPMGEMDEHYRCEVWIPVVKKQ